jgi:hypothetical protein
VFRLQEDVEEIREKEKSRNAARYNCPGHDRPPFSLSLSRFVIRKTTAVPAKNKIPIRIYTASMRSLQKIIESLALPLSRCCHLYYTPTSKNGLKNRGWDVKEA